MKKIGLGKRVLACVASAATLLTGTTALSAVGMQVQTLTASAASYDNYAKLLQYTMYFYDGNMCGSDVGSASQFTWRDNCHTADEVDGGYHDAGDHVKFGLPAGYTASTLGWGYYEYKDSYDALGQTAHLKALTDRFCDFFKASTKLNGNDVSSICYQVGKGKEDHNAWCSPESQTDQSLRTAYWTSDDASDIAAEYAAALAANYVNFGNAEDLTYAKALYNYSIRTNKAECSAATEFYGSYDYYDDQAWAAGWLYLATGDSSYQTFLNTFMNTSGAGKSGQAGCQWGVYSPMSWNNVSLGAAILQSEITGSGSDWSKVTTYLNSKCTSESQYYCEDPWGSARYNTTMQLAALVTSKYSAQSGKDYSGWCKAQMAMILGNNPKNVNFVVGMDSNSAKYPHHRAASGYGSFDEMKDQTGYSANGHTLVGALVGGPTDANFTYTDSVNDYKANEVALDYNAGIVGAAAGLYSIYKTGSIDSTIEGVNGSAVVTTEATQATTASTTRATTTTTKATQATQATTQSSSTSSGGATYSKNLNQAVDYDKLPATDRMIGWSWKDLGVKPSDKVTKVAVNITAKSGEIGKWQGAFGSSTSVAPGYWTQSDDMTQTINSKSGTITWDVDAATSSIIQVDYDGQLKFGIWWIDCTQFTIDSIDVYTSNGSPAVTGATTRATQATTKTTTASTNGSSSSGAYEKNLNQAVDYDKLPSTDRMIGWAWKDLGVKSGDKVTKVEVNITAKNGEIGKWQGAFGSSTSVAPGYWTQSDDMTQVINSKSGTITWDVDAATSSIIQVDYDGQLKFGIWWIDCTQFTIDSIKVYTGNGGSNVTTASTRNTQATTKTTTASTASGNSGVYEKNINQAVDYDKLPSTDRMIGWAWKDLGVKSGDKISKVEINITAKSGEIGKWQGAFGSSTSVAPGYWTQSDDMTQVINSKSGTITWDVDAATSSIIQVDYDGQLKFGIWWIDCTQFTIDSIKVYTGNSSSVTTASTTKATTKTTTTRRTTASTTKATTTTTKTTGTQPNWPEATLYGDVNLDGAIDLTDAVLLNKAIAGSVSLSDQQKSNANVCTDIGLSANDSMALLKFLVRLVNNLPTD
ncbi:glycoside hydrolase family 9 protein [Ruminococcus sp.]|uniref:glycoside hydrolase family 9 protein n=1 Tax=Ruminococcus sp. TaxID=41978 RepID=UPI002E79663F|nr:DUF5620 domain-containing protein [Ruminococcus sp.]MEE1396638.1 glycoside hydrolase family 9 protein [Ruminococcus sp.]